MFSESKFEISLHCDEESIESVLPKLHQLQSDLNSRRTGNVKNDFSFIDSLIRDTPNTLVENLNSTFSSSIAYPIPNALESDHATFRVLDHLLGNDFIINSVRQTLGAYGAFSYINDFGAGCLESSDDSCPNEVIIALQKDLNSIVNGKFDEEMLDRAKLRLLCELDRPVAPSQKGLDYFRKKITVEQQQSLRDAVFRTSKDDIIAAAKKIISGKLIITIIGNPSGKTIPEGILIEKL